MGRHLCKHYADGIIVDAEKIFDVVTIRPAPSEAAATTRRMLPRSPISAVPGDITSDGCCRPAQLEPKARKCRSFDEQQSVSSMSTIAQLASVALLSSVFLGASLAPTYALRMPESAGAYPTGQQVVSACARGEHTDPLEGSILSDGEIRHIKWCAAKSLMRHVALVNCVADDLLDASHFQLALIK